MSAIRAIKGRERAIRTDPAIDPANLPVLRGEHSPTVFKSPADLDEPATEVEIVPLKPKQFTDAKTSTEGTEE